MINPEFVKTVAEECRDYAAKYGISITAALIIRTRGDQPGRGKLTYEEQDAVVAYLNRERENE